MPWKMDGEHIAMQDGKPVWIGKDGNEAPFDAEHALNKIGELNGESAARKRELREAQDKLSVLDGIENPAEFMAQASKAMETVANLEAKKLIDAGEVEKVKAEVTKAMQERLDKKDKELADKDATLAKEMIGGRFSRSKFIAEKLNLPVDMVEARFGKAFKIEDGQVVAYDHHGQKIFSREKPGDVAGFDEALSILVDAYPNKDSILKGSAASGGGAQGDGGGSQGAKAMSREAFDNLDPAAKVAHVHDGGVVTE